MKEKLAALWAKVVDNKEIVIRVGAAVAGAVVGAAVASLVSGSQEEYDVDLILDVEEIEE